MRVESDVMVPMTDGTRLATDLFFPEDPASAPWPVILIRTPYDKQMMPFDKEAITADGLVVAIQDSRGRFQSEGKFSPLRNEGADGVDAIGWLREQDWCNGKVGTASGSYVGATQWLPALEQPEGLTCAMPQVTASLFHGFGFFARGVVQLDMFLLWMSSLADEENRRAGRSYSEEYPVLKAMREASGRLVELMIQGMLAGPDSEKREEINQRLMACVGDVMEKTAAFLSQPLNEAAAQVAEYAPWLKDWIEHVDDPDADFWQEFDWEPRREDVAIPMLHQAAWYDIFLRGQVKDFAALSARKDGAFQKLVILPEVHTGLSGDVLPIGEKLFPVKYSTDGYGLHKSPVDAKGKLSQRWCQHWLQDIDSGLLQEAPVTLYVQGEDVWRDEWEWPLARTEWTPLYLHSQGSANSVNGDGRLVFQPPNAAGSTSDQYRYDPADPVPSKGGSFLNMGIPPGVFEQSSVESRDDVLVYTSAELESDVEVTGPVTLKLWAATSAVDTDFTAKLVDVEPDGRAFNICDGVTRLRFRREAPGLVTPGEVQEVEVELSPTSYQFRAGHKIRLQVSSSNFPLFDPNSNTGKSLLKDKHNEMKIAEQTVFHDEQRSSHLLLPVIPRP